MRPQEHLGERLGVGYFVSTGNEGDLEFSDFCEYFADDPAVKIIGGYLESVRDGARFLRAVKRATSAGKPVILIKVGTTEVGERAVRSHTGALAGAEEAYRLAFRESGAVRASNIEELIDLLKVFSAFPDPQREPRRAFTAAPRVAVLSHSGGSGVLVGDACAAEGLALPAPSAALVERLRARLPAFASLQNPIDMTAGVVLDPALMGAVVRETMDSREYDATLLCVNLIWRQGKALASELVQAQQASPTPLAVAWVAGIPDVYESLAQSPIPAFTDPVRCAKAVATRLQWEVYRAQMEAAPEYRPAPEPAGDLQRFAGQQALLERYRIPQAPALLAADSAGALRAARALGFPVAAKLVATGLMHKSDAGGVVLGIVSDANLERAVGALEALPVRDREGVLVQKMVSGLELFAGFKRDATFGPVVVFGLGGIYVEVLKETVMRLAPFSPDQAAKLIASARFYPLLKGARGQPSCDIASLANILSQLSILAIEQPHIRALDLNPIMARADSAIVVDAKLELEEQAVQH